MKTKLFLSSMVLISTILVVSLNSCNKIKEAEKAANADPQSAKDYVKASSAFTNVFKKVNDVIQSKSLLKSMKNVEIDSCPKIIISSGSYPKTIKIIFDTINGCYSDGLTYKGTITEVVSGPLGTTGSVANISFKNFSIDGDLVDGVATLTTTGRNSSNKLVFNFVVSGGTVFTSDGTISFNTNQTWTWINGESTVWPDISDDEYQVDGTASGISTSGHHFTASTLASIVINMGCEWKLVTGIVNVVPDSGPDMSLYFGDGACDNTAVIKISGLSDVIVNF